MATLAEAAPRSRLASVCWRRKLSCKNIIHRRVTKHLAKELTCHVLFRRAPQSRQRTVIAFIARQTRSATHLGFDLATGCVLLSFVDVLGMKKKPGSFQDLRDLPLTPPLELTLTKPEHKP